MNWPNAKSPPLVAAASSTGKPIAAAAVSKTTINTMHIDDCASDAKEEREWLAQFEAESAKQLAANEAARSQMMINAMAQSQIAMAQAVRANTQLALHVSVTAAALTTATAAAVATAPIEIDRTAKKHIIREALERKAAASAAAAPSTATATSAPLSTDAPSAAEDEAQTSATRRAWLKRSRDPLWDIPPATEFEEEFVPTVLGVAPAAETVIPLSATILIDPDTGKMNLDRTKWARLTETVHMMALVMMRNPEICFNLTLTAMPLPTLVNLFTDVDASELYVGRLTMALASQASSTWPPVKPMTNLTLATVLLCAMVSSFIGDSGSWKRPVDTAASDALALWLGTNSQLDESCFQWHKIASARITTTAEIALGSAKLKLTHSCKPKEWLPVSGLHWTSRYRNMALSLLSPPAAHRTAILTHKEQKYAVRVWRRKGADAKSSDEITFCSLDAHQRLRKWVFDEYPPFAKYVQMRGAIAEIKLFERRDETRDFVGLDWCRTAFAASWYACEVPSLMRYLHDKVYVPYVGKQSLQEFFTRPDYAESINLNHQLCLPLFLCHVLGWGTDEVLVAN
jgi:hypothetical protein